MRPKFNFFCRERERERERKRAASRYNRGTMPQRDESAAKKVKAPQQTLYELLRVEKTATAVEIRKAFLVLARAAHPDKNPDKGAKEAFQVGRLQLTRRVLKRCGAGAQARVRHSLGCGATREIRPHGRGRRRTRRCVLGQCL